VKAQDDPRSGQPATANIDEQNPAATAQTRTAATKISA